MNKKQRENHIKKLEKLNEKTKKLYEDADEETKNFLNNALRYAFKSIKLTQEDLENYKIYKLEQLEKENKELKEKCKMLEENQETVLTTLEILVQENTKLKQALDKACERLDYSCPVEEELINDLDCENCESDCKECWVKFFLKEVLDCE